MMRHDMGENLVQQGKRFAKDAPASPVPRRLVALLFPVTAVFIPVSVYYNRCNRYTNWVHVKESFRIRVESDIHLQADCARRKSAEGVRTLLLCIVRIYSL
jgi:hypothetical protein